MRLPNLEFDKMSRLLARLRNSRLMKCIRPMNDPDESEKKDSKAFSNVQSSGRHGLNPRQVFLLKQNWKGVMREEEAVSIETHIKLFKTNADLKNLFAGFKDIDTDDELRANEALEYHATLVMTTLDDAITHIDDYEFIKKLLRKTGGSHRQFKGFEPDNFMAIKGPFLEAVKDTLGDRYTENMENIYNIAITFILEELITGIKEAQKAHGQKADETSSVQ